MRESLIDSFHRAVEESARKNNFYLPPRFPQPEKTPMQKLIAQLKLFWRSLPHQAQAAIICFVTAAVTYLHSVFTGPNDASFDWPSLAHDVRTAVGAGLAAVWAFYMTPNRQSPPDPPILITNGVNVPNLPNSNIGGSMKRCFSLVLVGVLLISSTACSTDEVLSTIDVALQTAESLESVVGAVSPADAAALEALTGLATVGLNAIKKDYDTYEASKAQGDLEKLQAAIAALQSNLSLNLSAAHIVSPAAVQKTTAWVNLINSSLDAVVATLEATLHPSLLASRNLAQLPTPQSLQARWAREVCQNDSACVAKVKVHRKRAHQGFWKGALSGLGNAIGEAWYGG